MLHLLGAKQEAAHTLHSSRSTGGSSISSASGTWMTAS
jgi:hypothetical protein